MENRNSARYADSACRIAFQHCPLATRILLDVVSGELALEPQSLSISVQNPWIWREYQRKAAQKGRSPIDAQIVEHGRRKEGESSCKG